MPRVDLNRNSIVFTFLMPRSILKLSA